MDIHKLMLIVKGKDRTSDIADIEEDEMNDKIVITFNNNKEKEYSYNKEDVVILQNPKTIKLENHIICEGEMPIYKAQYILDFDEWYRIIKDDGTVAASNKKEVFTLVKSGITATNAMQNLNYLKAIAAHTSTTKEEDSFLKKEMDKICFVHPESVLSCYLNQESIKSRKCNANIIFPFKMNLSQKAAAEKAFKHSVTVIEGPPGTGKTQTILNILANLITLQGKSVAVVSNNNEAVKNVHEKLEENGYGFLAASLGKFENQEKFFLNMPEAKVDGWDCDENIDLLSDKVNNLTNTINDLLKKKREQFKLEQELRAWELEQKHFEEYYNNQSLDKINKLPLLNENADKILDFLVDTSLAKENKKLYKSIYRLEFIHKLRLLYKYGLFNYRKLKENETAVLLALQREYYKKRIVELDEDINMLRNDLENASFKERLDEHQMLSENCFESIYLRCTMIYRKRNFR